MDREELLRHGIPLGTLEKLLEVATNKVEHKFATEEGQGLIGGERMKHYGSPDNNINDIGKLWNTYAKRALEAKGYLDGTDVCSMMILLKVMRQARGYHRDSTVDECGYAGLAEALNEEAALTRLMEEANG